MTRKLIGKMTRHFTYADNLKIAGFAKFAGSKFAEYKLIPSQPSYSLQNFDKGANGEKHHTSFYLERERGNTE